MTMEGYGANCQFQAEIGGLFGKIWCFGEIAGMA